MLEVSNIDTSNLSMLDLFKRCSRSIRKKQKHGSEKQRNGQRNKSEQKGNGHSNIREKQRNGSGKYIQSSTLGKNGRRRNGSGRQRNRNGKHKL